jgi:hypothetical protein
MAFKMKGDPYKMGKIATKNTMAQMRTSYKMKEAMAKMKHGENTKSPDKDGITMKKNSPYPAAKPDYPDIDGDGNTTESMKKAAADKKSSPAQMEAKKIISKSGDKIMYAKGGRHSADGSTKEKGRYTTYTKKDDGTYTKKVETAKKGSKSDDDKKVRKEKTISAKRAERQIKRKARKADKSERKADVKFMKSRAKQAVKAGADKKKVRADLKKIKKDIKNRPSEPIPTVKSKTKRPTPVTMKSPLEQEKIKNKKRKLSVLDKLSAASRAISTSEGPFGDTNFMDRYKEAKRGIRKTGIRSKDALMGSNR